MKRSIALSAAATVAAALLTACGGDVDLPGTGDETGAYCDDLETAKADIDKLQEGDVASFDQVFKTIDQLAKDAPEEVSADWKTLDGSLDEFEQALNDAGLELSDMEKLSNGEIPQGVDPQKLQTLGQDLQKLNSEDTEKAADAIEKHAKEECDIDLSEEPSGSESGSAE